MIKIKNGEQTVQLTVRFPPDVGKKLEELAKRKNRSRNGQIVQAVIEQIEREESANG